MGNSISNVFSTAFPARTRHVAVGGEHDKAFCDCLDRMIEKFNAATGASLVNDYGPGERSVNKKTAEKP